MKTRSRLGRCGFLGALLVVTAGVGLLARGPAGLRAADAADQQANTLTEAEKDNGWKLLFDGKTTEGWRRYKGKEVGDRWQVVDGTLTLQPKGGKTGGDIVTVDQYENFELALDWRISPGGNSGLMYHVSEEFGSPFQTGPEYQILDNAKHADGKSPLTSSAACYALYPPSKDMTKPVGEWNRTRLLVNGRHVEHWLNGEKVVQYEIGSDDWDAKVKASKFKNMPKFGKEPRGHIDLQDHGNEVAFRNIKIRVLKDSK